MKKPTRGIYKKLLERKGINKRSPFVSPPDLSLGLRLLLFYFLDGDSFQQACFQVFLYYYTRLSLCRTKNRLTRRSILKIYANLSVLELGLIIRDV